jgi:hypothetical protein
MHLHNNAPLTGFGFTFGKGGLHTARSFMSAEDAKDWIEEISGLFLDQYQMDQLLSGE